MNAADPYRYFRIEARELVEGLTSAALGLEKGEAPEDCLGRILRQAHTLKGAARVVKHERIAELAHAVEEALAAHRAETVPVPPERVDEVLHLIDEISANVGTLEPKTQDRPRELPRSNDDECLEGLRVERADVDALLQGIAAARAQLVAMQKTVASLEHGERLAGMLVEQIHAGRLGVLGGTERGSGLARMRSAAEELRLSMGATTRVLEGKLEVTDREVAQLYDRTNRLRLLRASAIVASLERVVRDAARTLQKRVEFQVLGDEVRMEAPVLEGLRSALVQTLRNAVAHGIESERERVAAGKPPSGCVRLEWERQGNRIVVRCRDDGRGVDVQAVQRAAVSRGLISAAEAESLGLEEAVRLVMRGGVSTSPSVTELAGRGIGLDVVRAAVTMLRGTVEIHSEWGVGTTVELGVPVSLTALPVLVVDAAVSCVSIPLEAVCQALRVPSREFTRSAEGDHIPFQGGLLPFVSLGSVLSGNPEPDRKAITSVVVVSAGPRRVALGVAHLRGTSDVVVQSVPALAAAKLIVAGVSLDTEGTPQLLLDPAALMDHVLTSKPSTADVDAPLRPPILIVDDSLTTRMLEQSILESAGYDVEMATSAEEALEKVRDRHYGLFVVDVEMPGMSGFELVEHTRSDPALRDIPAILVTSRNSPEDRHRGEAVGARAFIVKSEFNQEHLLSTIQRLIG